MKSDNFFADELPRVKELLADFKIPDETKDVSVDDYVVLSPDSFIWRLLIGDRVYFLYAEDYIPSLQHVLGEVQNTVSKETKLEFIEVKHSESFEDTKPVRTAQVYKLPGDKEKIMKYATTMRYYFVFLCRSSDKPEDYFNAEAYW